MNLINLFRKIGPYVRPYRWLVVLTLILTLIGSFIAQINAVVLDRTVDAINNLINTDSMVWSRAAHILSIITLVLLGKEVLSAAITYAQHFFGEKMRINVSKDLSQAVIDQMLRYRMAFFSRANNETGKLQTRIDQGVSSLSSTVQNFFIDLLPLFMSAVLALILMFAANVYVGLAALGIVPIYIWITIRQARKLQGWRRNMRSYREQKSHGVMNIIESINVIKSFNREQIESDKQWQLQTEFTDNQMRVRKTSFYFDGMKSFVRQVGTVLIIILTAYLVMIDYPGMTIGKIMYHVMLFSNVTAPITQLQRIFDQMNDALIYAEGFFDILEADGECEPSGTYRPERVEGNFELSGVDFTYPNGTKALHNIDMRIESGKITALVGLSGAGKSTVLNLLVKFYSPDCGSIK
ncbi:MAG: ABC transporter ATP-binding protein, partial [Rikenellaceae bacterium]|nr:ABC transporter ATP-binding protein [Rikenellaceae bacterium]